MLIEAVMGGLSYVRSNPLVLVQAARNAARFELSVPMELLQWAIDRRPRGKGPERIELTTSGNALRLSLTVDLYGTKIDVSADLSIESIENLPEQFKVAVRVADLQIVAPPQSPASMMIGSLDLSKPGSLMKMMPQKHAALIDASDDVFVFDLLKIPALANNHKFRRLLGALSFMRVRSVRGDGALLAIGVDVSPTEIPGALVRARSA